MKILGIETSCDETAISLIEAHGTFERDFTFRILGNALLSQAKLHEQYGGVFPNVAKREHQRALVPVLQEVFRQAGLHDAPRSVSEEVIAELGTMLEREPELFINLGQFLHSIGAPDVDAIAVTVGPGLEPALWVGINFAKALSLAWNAPVVAANHMEGHIMLSASDGDRLARFDLPLLSLLISGGHTELVLSKRWMEYELLGATRDDAVGEAFDKVARLLDLPYPGGPHISRLASEARLRQGESATQVTLPRPMIDSKDYDFSFAGLKTAVRRLVEAGAPLSEDSKCALAREFEDACADVLIAKSMRAIEEFGAQALVVGGGVSANEHIRARLRSAIDDFGYETKLLIPPPELATDNALMIALAGYFRAQKREFARAETLRANGNLKLA
jgi:N6-L-threonylcarbamoyladenine synthase